jgi:hypothetical protein
VYNYPQGNIEVPGCLGRISDAWDELMIWLSTTPAWRCCCGGSSDDLERAVIFNDALRDGRAAARMNIGYNNSVRDDMLRVQELTQISVLLDETNHDKLAKTYELHRATLEMSDEAKDTVAPVDVSIPVHATKPVFKRGAVEVRLPIADQLDGFWSPGWEPESVPCVSMTRLVPLFAARVALHMEREMGRMRKTPANEGAFERSLQLFARDNNIRQELLSANKSLITALFFQLNDDEVMSQAHARFGRIRRFKTHWRTGPDLA